MEKFDEILNAIEQQSKTTVQRKRKWREIEQLKEKYQLEKELKMYDDSLEHMLNEF